MRTKIIQQILCNHPGPPNPVAYHLPRALYPTGTRVLFRRQQAAVASGFCRCVSSLYCTRSDDKNTTVGGVQMQRIANPRVGAWRTLRMYG